MLAASRIAEFDEHRRLALAISCRLARARSFALNIMRHDGGTNIAQELWEGALSLEHILAYKAI